MADEAESGRVGTGVFWASGVQQAVKHPPVLTGSVPGATAEERMRAGVEEDDTGVVFLKVQVAWVLSCSPVEHPGVGLVRQADVVLGQQPRQPGSQRGPVHPALAGAALIHRRHEDVVAGDQLQLVLVLGRVGVHHPQRLRRTHRFTSHLLLDPPYEQPLAWTYLVVCEANVPGEEDRQPITTQLDLDAFGQFLQ